MNETSRGWGAKRTDQSLKLVSRKKKRNVRRKKRAKSKLRLRKFACGGFSELRRKGLLGWERERFLHGAREILGEINHFVQRRKARENERGNLRVDHLKRGEGFRPIKKKNFVAHKNELELLQKARIRFRNHNRRSVQLTSLIFFMSHHLTTCRQFL